MTLSWTPPTALPLLLQCSAAWTAYCQLQLCCRAGWFTTASAAAVCVLPAMRVLLLHSSLVHHA